MGNAHPKKVQDKLQLISMKQSWEFIFCSWTIPELQIALQSLRWFLH